VAFTTSMAPASNWLLILIDMVRPVVVGVSRPASYLLSPRIFVGLMQRKWQRCRLC
jgi:hypothetical protein